MRRTILTALLALSVTLCLSGAAMAARTFPETPAVTIEEVGASSVKDLPFGLARPPEDPVIPGTNIPDADGDNVPDDTDNCVDDPNAYQIDTDGDGVGDACDDCPGDYLDECMDDEELLDDEPEEPVDADGDGIADEEDACPDVAGDYAEQGCPLTDEEQEELAEEALAEYEAYSMAFEGSCSLAQGASPNRIALLILGLGLLPVLVRRIR